MNESECLSKMKAPADRRTGKPYHGCVIQVLITSSCNLGCFNCTQASQLRRKPWFMTLEQVEQALVSLKGFYGTVGIFGGNPALHPRFEDVCSLVRKHVPWDHTGIWCNDPLTPENATAMRSTFNPTYSNLNVHMDQHAYDLFKVWWPESNPFGLDRDSRHSPPWVAMKDVLRKDCDLCEGGRVGDGSHPDGSCCPECKGTGEVYAENRAWHLIAHCDINQYWSAGIGVFRGELRAWFCEVAMAQSILHQDEPTYPDTGVGLGPYSYDGAPWMNSTSPEKKGFMWWELPMEFFRGQVRKHCHECGIPLRGHGALAQGEDSLPSQVEQVTSTHSALYKPKRQGRKVEVVDMLEQLGVGRLTRATDYLGNAGR